jgi:long-subunit fatty acid transport protein
MRPVVTLALGLGFGFAAGSRPAAASGPLLFQHGGRPTGQVGAFAARAEDAGSIVYNPASVARLRGAHYQLGFDYTAPVDEYHSATGSFEQDKLITESPALYATWHLPESYYPWSFGVGIDEPAWYLADWAPALFPGRFLTRKQKLQLWSVHPVVGFELGERWSIGAGLRYYTGKLDEGNNALFPFPPPDQTFSFEVARTASANVDGESFDLGVLYAAPTWSWGFAFDTGGKVKGNGKVKYEARDLPSDPVIQAAFNNRFRSGSTSQSFELPPEARMGISTGSKSKLELDVVWTEWSVVDQTSVSYRPDAFVSPGTANVTEHRNRDWKDTVSLRLGGELWMGEHWALSGGIAQEPSPVPNSTVEPGFARDDARVYATGITYRIRDIFFDLSYSYYQYSDRHASGQELQHPQVPSTYETRDQAFGFSISWGK